MIAPPKPALAALALGVLVASAGPAAAQDRFAGQDALRDPSVELSEITGRVEQAVSTIMAKREDFASLSTEERNRVVIEALRERETEFRAILELLDPASPMMDAINDARANVLVMLRRSEREEPSAERDARLAEFTHALASIENQVGQIRAADAPLTAMVDEIRSAEAVPDVAEGLSAMAAVLATLSANIMTQESCSAGSEPLRASTGAAEAPRRSRAPCSEDLVSNPMSTAGDGPPASPRFHDMRNPE